MLIHFIILYTHSVFTPATRTHCHLVRYVLTQYVWISHQHMNTGSMLKIGSCDFFNDNVTDRWWRTLCRQPHAPTALPIKQDAVCVPQLLGTQKARTNSSSLANGCSLQTGTSHTVMRPDALTKVGIRQRSSGLWRRIFWQTGYNGSKNPPVYTYRAVQSGLFNDVTATAQIQNSKERPTGVHGRLSRSQCLENKTFHKRLT
jgi:hypothetical protein